MTLNKFIVTASACVATALLGAGAASASAAASAAAAAKVDTSGPTQLIETAANTMVSEIAQRRAEFRKEPSKLYQLVDAVLLPHFDVDFAARAVLGTTWRSASDDQRRRFVTAFYHSLLNNYGDALVDFTGDRIRVFPSNVADDATRATVRTEVKRSNGQKVPVNYTLRKTDGGWKAWDVTIEGISYVKSFKEDFAAEINQKGLDAVIQRLETQASQSGVAQGA